MGSGSSRLQRLSRLRNAKDFRRVGRRGRRFASRDFVVLIARNPLADLVADGLVAQQSDAERRVAERRVPQRRVPHKLVAGDTGVRNPKQRTGPKFASGGRSGAVEGQRRGRHAHRPHQRLGHQRLGVTVSRKVGNAVVRNRVKRGIREWFRTQRAMLDDDIDIVIIARPSAATLDTREIAQRLRAILSIKATT